MTGSRLASEMPQQRVFQFAIKDLRRAAINKMMTSSAHRKGQRGGKNCDPGNSRNTESYSREKGVRQLINRVHVNMSPRGSKKTIKFTGPYS